MLFGEQGGIFSWIGYVEMPYPSSIGAPQCMEGSRHSAKAWSIPGSEWCVCV
jgi:hypothetical protein